MSLLFLCCIITKTMKHVIRRIISRVAIAESYLADNDNNFSSSITTLTIPSHVPHTCKSHISALRLKEATSPFPSPLACPSYYLDELHKKYCMINIANSKDDHYIPSFY